MKIYKATCRVCKKTIESESRQKTLSLMKVHLLTHDQFNQIIEKLTPLFIEIEETEVEVAII